MKDPSKLRAPAVFLLALLATAGALAFAVHSLVRNSGSGDFLGQLAHVAAAGGHIVGFAAAVGLVSMAVVEATKRLFPVRGYFHSAALRQCLGKNGFATLVVSVTAPLSAEITRMVGPGLLTPAMREFRVDRSVSELALFNAPLEQLIGQIAALSQQQLDRVLYPTSATSPSSPMGGATPSPSSAGATPTEAASERAKGDTDLLDAILRFPIGLLVTARGDSKSDSFEGNMRAQLDLELNQLQIQIGNRWRRLVRTVSSVTAALLATGILVLSGVDPEVTVGLIVSAFLVGGFFSWLSRDAVAAIERWRH
jgi:hypothetical protein